MSRPIPPHGNANRYAYGCRCKACTKAASRADAQRKLDRLAGRPRTVDAGPAAEHAQKLLDSGLTFYQVGRESGLEPSTIRRLVNGQKMIRSVNADKVLAVPLNVRVTAGDVPSVGAVRRVRALYALGHLNWQIAAEAGVSRDGVCALAAGRWPTIKVAMDDGIRRAYNRLSMTTGTSWKTRNLAAKNGWVSPLAWDDESIDDPDATPATDAPAPAATEGENVAARWLMGESVVLSAEARLEALCHLFEWTDMTIAQIAARLEMTPSAAEQTWHRHRRKLRAQGEPVPWRRRWELRDKELTKNEMGEAA
ncbi:hypothetical protein ACFW9D_05825 [Streptomyces sp. NPDC059524]|uniref:hypothetical protein n=1 Tax=Streptomyces sp. NPDC059524 TaxID=3346856 RepID=UPI00368AB9B8